MNKKIVKNKKVNLSDVIQKIIIYAILVLLCIVILTPVIWIVLSSFNSGTSLFSSSIIPKNPTLIHYKELFTQTDFPKWYMNTFKIAIINMVLSVILTTLSAYAFSRFKFKGRKQGLMAMMILQMFPGFLAMTAVFILISKLGLLNSHWGLILVYAGGQIPYNTWLCKGFFDGIPRSLDEAAKIDGASNMTIFVKVILPLARPIITLVALTNFMGPWFDFIFPQIILKSSEKKTLAMGLFEWVQKQQNTQFTMFAAGAILVAIPITLLFVYLQKHIVEGLASGATKG
ncbi:sugar ABC transporter permease [Clostridium sp. CM028]|uniref:sugar ABC transporter permease n=1 Tax=Clostridium sp. CM028 TaxID=2851575 RepID=UPI001C6EC5D6|nr:sugar ABC transporter permease [Clostridium sp. CM028]MBW9149198.1 sugar ABC transporter permease [Clostridium sp. CM028]WLC61204.1 sugar ABC transporter permease [Clostridium sp. CM028]